VYLYLTNRLFVNRKMIEMGLAIADRNCSHRYRERFIAAEEKQNG
jgi:endonuclease YncB( thermonuclease family)